MLQGPFDSNRMLLEWEMNRWVDEGYTQQLPPEVRRELGKVKGNLLSRLLYVLAPVIAAGIIMLNGQILYSFFK